MQNFAKRILQSVAERASRRTLERLAESDFADDIAYRTASETILQGLKDGETPRDRLQSISDGFWFWLCTEGCRRNAAIRQLLPGMPPVEAQLRFTGDEGDVTLREGYQAWRIFRDQYEKHRGLLRDCQAVLDFGCGWGRILRFFLKDVAPTALLGVDPVVEMISLCKSTYRWGRFEQIPFQPPSQLPADSFELIYSFSLYSHLSEKQSRTVLEEQTRLLRPGGLLMVTTRSRGFIDYCAGLRANAQILKDKPGHESSAVAFPDTAGTKRNYDAGQYCFHSFRGRGDWEHWGEAVIPRGYVEREWTRNLQLLEFFDDPARLAQVVIVLRKPTN